MSAGEVRPIDRKSVLELRTECAAAGVDPEGVFSLRSDFPFPADRRFPRCVLCGAPFLTVAAAVVTARSGRRHVAHVDCVDLELEAPKASRRIVGDVVRLAGVGT
jgi:hypothetical protein